MSDSNDNKVKSLSSLPGLISSVCLLSTVAACSGSSSGEQEQTVTDDVFVFAGTENLVIPVDKGVLANDGADFGSVALLTPVNSSSSLVLNADGSFTYKPGAGLTTDNFSYRATKPNGESKSANVSISLIQDATTCVESDIRTNTTFNIDLLEDQLARNYGVSLTLLNSPTKGTISDISDTTQALSYSFSGNSRGKDSFQFTVADNYGGSSTLTYDIGLYPVRIMPLGDSITQGITSDSTDEPGDPIYDSPAMNVRVGYRKDLYNMLLSAGFEFNFVGSQTDAGFSSFSEYRHQGHPGFSDYEVAGITDPDGSNAGDTFNPNTQGVYNWLDQNNADVILLHAGTNNVRYRTSSVGVENILNEVNRWDSDNNSTTSVFVAKIVDKNRSSADHQNVVSFNNDLQAMLNSRSSGENLTTVDMYNAVPYSISPTDTATFDSLDRTHLTPYGYYKMALGWKNSIDIDPTILGKCP